MSSTYVSIALPRDLSRKIIGCITLMEIKYAHQTKPQNTNPIFPGGSGTSSGAEERTAKNRKAPRENMETYQACSVLKL